MLCYAPPSQAVETVTVSRVRRKALGARTAKPDPIVTDEAILSFERDILERICRSVNTPRSLAVSLLAREGEWTQLLELTFPDPLSPSFADDYLVSELLTKNPRLPLALSKRDAAIAKFKEAEQMCKATNLRWQHYFEKPAEHSRELHTILAVQSIVSDSLGPLSKNKLMHLESEFRFGPGATSSVGGRNVLLSRKYTSRIDVTPRLAPYIRAITGRMKGEVSILNTSRVTTVPKNAKTDRTICIEPHGNIYYQLGIGSLLRGCLTRLGLEPNNQGRNRRMASTAVRDGYATIDLSMASDTVSKEVVFRLLPDDWFQLLWIGRTDRTTLDGVEVPLEKFSSMGNGFTWELESLIFYALARRLTKKDIGVFGDDLVVPIEIVPQLSQDLELFGFKMNSRKSFWQGDFRESCGTDWWRSIDVRPFYLRKNTNEIHSVAHYAVHVANAVRYYAHRRGDRVFCDHRFLPAWLRAKQRSGAYSDSYTSYGYGDDGIHRNFDECCPSRLRHGLQGYVGKIYKRSTRSSRGTDPNGAYLAALDKGLPMANSIVEKRGVAVPTQVSRLIETQRGYLGNPKPERVPIFDWYDLGPWL